MKRFIELVFYLVIIYMIISEFKRDRKREYKYLIVGFFALFFRQAVMSIILFSRIFSVNGFMRFGVLIWFIDTYLETAALILIVSAFVFPAFKEKTFTFQKRIIYSLYLVTIIIFGTYFLFKAGFFEQQYVAIILNLVQVGVLISPFFLFSKGKYRNIHFPRSILLAFFIYLLLPLSSIIGLLYNGSVDERLFVAQHPLPFLSILLLMRTVYLKLVDKAFLTSKLKKSENMVKHERELNKLKDHFISVVSHELRTPITSVKLYLSLLKKGKFGNISRKQDDAIRRLIDENNRLSDLITNLLTINRIEANKIVLDKTDFYFNEIIDDLYINIARNKGIEVINKVGKRLKVHADKKMLKQVYINLMNNAIKFSEKSGRIELKSGREKNGWSFSIRDTGIGISNDEIPKLFNKFYQVDNTFTRKNQGIGLGLSIVKNIVELHNGRIDVESEPGKWTEFKICVPFKE
ncbi:MAG: HAMP domain-containing histidine kinase [Nanoarchaeota archaeon]|nr:HAMP domain-containing histidine kinase [Nanoarchaeota archaeon]